MELHIFKVGRQEEEHQIRISWEIETQLFCPPVRKLVKHEQKQKLRHFRICMSNPHLPEAFYHTRDYIDGFQCDTLGDRNITDAYHQHQVSGFCEFFIRRKPSSQTLELNFSKAIFKEMKIY